MLSTNFIPKKDTEPAAKEQNTSSPFLIEFFMVQCAGLMCMAYRNREGKWRGAFDNRELPGIVQVLG